MLKIFQIIGVATTLYVVVSVISGETRCIIADEGAICAIRNPLKWGQTDVGVQGVELPIPPGSGLALPIALIGTIVAAYCIGRYNVPKVSLLEQKSYGTV
jgi:hypothetical protein